MKKKIILSVMVIAIAVSLIASATTAILSDKETSIGNTFTAATLDLNINGGNVNAPVFDVPNFRPYNQPSTAYTLTNVGSINGYLDISKITVTNIENGRLDPEIEAGDVTPDVGEIGDLVNITLYFDNVLDGKGLDWGDEIIWSGLLKDMPTSLALNDLKLHESYGDTAEGSSGLIAAGQSRQIKVVLNWWPTDNDNLAQGDSLTLDFEFTLSQVE